MHAQNMDAVQGRLHRPAHRAMNPLPGILFASKCAYKALSLKPDKHCNAKTMKQG